MSIDWSYLQSLVRFLFLLVDKYLWWFCMVILIKFCVKISEKIPSYLILTTFSSQGFQGLVFTLEFISIHIEIHREPWWIAAVVFRFVGLPVCEVNLGLSPWHSSPWEAVETQDESWRNHWLGNGDAAYTEFWVPKSCFCFSSFSWSQLAFYSPPRP